MWVILKWYKNQEKLNINANKKVETITCNSFDFFYYLILFNKCRGPPTSFNFQILKLNGGIKMENERPKRNRYEDNPYYLYNDNRNNKYYVNFDIDRKKYDVEITKELFEDLDNTEKYEAKKIQYDKRYLEKSYQTDINLYNRALHKPISIEDELINKMERKKLYAALKTLSPIHKRRILLYYKHNLSMSEIAEIEGCSKVAIKYSIDIALEKLRDFFNKF